MQPQAITIKAIAGKAFPENFNQGNLNKETKKFYAGPYQARQFKAISDKEIPEGAISCNVRQANPGIATLGTFRQDNSRQGISRQNNSRLGNSRILQPRQ